MSVREPNRVSAINSKPDPTPALLRADDGIEPRAGEYAQALRESLGEDLQCFVQVFAETRRVKSVAQLLARHFDGPAGWVLNVGCGPFATEFFVQALHRHRIVSFDYTRGFAPAYRALRQRGHLANTLFFFGNALSAEFEPESFDLIIMHDLLFMPTLSLDVLLPKYDRYLRPGGLLFLTVLDVRTRWIWKLLGREKTYKRYAIPAVRALLETHGYRLLDCVPSALETKGWLNQMFRRMLWHGFGLSNQYAILARKEPRG